MSPRPPRDPGGLTGVLSGVRLIATAVAALALAACAAPGALPGTGHVQGHVTVTPCSPVERFPPSPCPPAAGVRVDFGRFWATTDAAGNYAIDLPPGDYDATVRAGIAPRPHRIHVAAGDHLTLDLDVDSGIR